MFSDSTRPVRSGDGNGHATACSDVNCSLEGKLEKLRSGLKTAEKHGINPSEILSKWDNLWDNSVFEGTVGNSASKSEDLMPDIFHLETFPNTIHSTNLQKKHFTVVLNCPVLDENVGQVCWNTAELAVASCRGQQCACTLLCPCCFERCSVQK